MDTLGKKCKKIEEYIRNQLKEDLEYDQMSLQEYIDPFMGEPVNRSKKKWAQGAKQVTEVATGKPFNESLDSSTGNESL